MSSTEKGVSLIILIVTIVLLGILGVGLVSFMSSKWRGYPVEVRSYEALNIANAGVEFAIRYAYERREEFFQHPYNVIPMHRPEDGPCSPSSFKKGKIGRGEFLISYNTDSNELRSCGISGIARREVRLRHFAGYLQGGISLVPGTGPYRGAGHQEDPHKIFIPLLNNQDRPLYVFKIHLNLQDKSGHNADYVQEITFRSNGSSTTVYDYTSDGTCRNESICPECGDAPCKEGGKGIEIPEPNDPYGDATLIFNRVQYYRLPLGISTEIIEFKSAANKGTYNMKVFWVPEDNPDFQNPQVSTISFVID